MRLLVLDGSRVLPSLVRRLAPVGVEVETATSFDEARERVCNQPPDAVIVNLGPSELDWVDLRYCCGRHSPPIPVLFESCVHKSPLEAGLGDLDESCAFLHKPYSLQALRIQIERLMEAARAENRGATVKGVPRHKPTIATGQ